MNIFISYSHKDREWCDRLATQLGGIGKSFVTEVWYDSAILPGSIWNAEIMKRMVRADIVILLISENFLGAKFCPREVELAIRQRSGGKCVIVPILLDYCLYDRLGLGQTDPLPKGGKPIRDAKAWPNEALALEEIAKQIQEVSAARKGIRAHPEGLSLELPDEIRELLYYYCDRGPQAEAVHQALGVDRFRPERPSVMIFYGRFADRMDTFVERLTDVILRRYFPGKSIAQLTLNWPSAARPGDPYSVFGPFLTDTLSVSPRSSKKDANKGLFALNWVNILRTDITAASWSSTTEALFAVYLRLWKEWPRLPKDRHLVPVVLIIHDDRGDLNPDILKFLQTPELSSDPDVEVAILPGFKEVEYFDFWKWLQLKEVREAIPKSQRVIDLAGDDSIKTAFPMRINKLAGETLPQLLGGI